MEHLVKSRRAIAFVVTAALMMVLRRNNLSPDDLLRQYGVSFTELQDGTIDFLTAAVLPGWVGWAWPNDPSKGILDYWRLALSGVLAIAAVAALVLAL